MPETYHRYEERDTYYDDEPPRGPPSRGPPSRRPPPPREEDFVYERREERRPMPPMPPPPREEEVFYERREERRSRTPPPPPSVARRSDVSVAVREEVDRESRVPHFMREETRRSEAGPLVLRQREIETNDRFRPRPRSPSPPPIVRERIVTKTRARSPSPGPPPPPPPPPEIREREEIRTRIVDHSRERVRSPSRGPALDRVRLGTRIIERPERSPSPPPPPPPPVVERVRTRVIERERSPSPRSPPPPEFERSRLRIVERERERVPTPSPSPPPPPPEPPVIRGPTIEREVITHYRDIDHGMVVARPPSPPPPPRRVEKRETEIDIYNRGNDTEIDITKTRSHSRGGARSASRERPRHYDPPPARDRSYYHGDEVIISSGRDKLKVDIEHERRSSSARPSSHSAAPDYGDEEDEITGRIDSRGRMGEAWGGRTKDWTLVDVPPGTERVRMDGVGGGSAEVSWQRYNGNRKTKFVAERASDGALAPLSPPPSSSTTVISDRVEYERPRDRERDRLSVQIYDKDRGGERDVEVEKVTDRRITLRPSLPAPAPPKPRNMWTEITKDLVAREAIDELGYDYEETELFFYVMQYLRYEDVLELVELSDRIRSRRKERIREIQYEREMQEEWERERRARDHRDRWDDERERVVEREVIYDTGRPRRY